MRARLGCALAVVLACPPGGSAGTADGAEGVDSTPTDPVNARPRGPFALVDGLSLPEAPTGRARTSDDVVQVLTGGVVYRHERFESSHETSFDLTKDSLDALARAFRKRAPGQHARLVVAANEADLGPTLEVLDLAERAGFRQFGFMARTPAGDQVVVDFDAPLHPSAPPADDEARADLMVRLLPHGVWFSPDDPTRSRERVASIEAKDPGADAHTAARWDRDGLARRAEELSKKHPDDPRVYVTAEPSIPVAAVVFALSDLRGPECATREEAQCMFSRAILSGLLPAAPKVETSFNSGIGGYGGFGGRGRRVPRIRQAKAKITGALDKDIVRRIVRAHINEVRGCYNRGLTQNPNLQGRVAVEFVVGSDGKVTSSKVKETSLKIHSVATCTANAVKRWKFPKPKDGKNVTVVYPFNLSPG